MTLTIIIVSCLIPHKIDIEVLPEKTLESEIHRLSLEYNVDEQLAINIMKCESQIYDRAVNENKRKDGTVWSRDFGIWQINDYYHEEEATKLGYDIHDKWQNLEFGFLLLSKGGTKYWKASQFCWDK